MRRSLTDAAGKEMKVTDIGDGILLAQGPPTNTAELTKEFFHNIPNTKCRDDDVMMMSWPKTAGSLWLFEMLQMLIHKSLERQKNQKITTMLEFVSPEVVDSSPSPRILNTHVPYRFLPRDMVERKVKAILLVRNPKDTLVSLYNHIIGYREYEYHGAWGDWLQLYMRGEIIYGPYSNYLKQFEKAMEDGTGFPIHIVHYEDLKQNGVQELMKLATFLEVDADKELCSRINQNCSFAKMSKEYNTFPDEFEKMVHKRFSHIRKGQIGDWKTWFTVSQSDQFDEYWQKEMKGSKMKFIYSPNTSPK